MTSYNAVFVTSYRGDPPEQLVDTLTDRLAAYHVSVGAYDGRVCVTVSYPAEHVDQAYSTGVAVVRAAFAGLGLEVVAVAELMTTADFDRHWGMAPIPELLSVSEVAAELDVSPQAVRQRLDSGSIAGVKAGATWVVPRPEVTRVKEAAGR